MAPKQKEAVPPSSHASRFLKVVSPSQEIYPSQNHKMSECEASLKTPVTSATTRSIGENGIADNPMEGSPNLAPFVSPDEEEAKKGKANHRSKNNNISNTVVTPSEAAATADVGTTKTVDDRDQQTPPTARRTLFHTSNHLVTPSQNLTSTNRTAGRKRSGAETGDVIKPPPPAKRRLIFGKMVDQIQCNPNVKTIYGIVRKLTGSIGGNGYSGPIYGELTMGSMQKMINMMITHTQLDSTSRFIDVGSGIGKPNLHVAQYPGVEFSCGVEMERVRFSLGMTCLQSILNAAAAQKLDLSPEEAIQSRCIFLHRNIQEARTFDPFTHVYMFSIGFPPPLWVELSEMWNRSQSDYLICYHGPKAIIQEYEFEVELLAQTPTSMHGSKEGHTGYIYKRKDASTTTITNTTNDEKVPCDALFADAWKLVKSGLEPLRQAVKSELNENENVGRTTRSRNSSKLTRIC